MESKLKLLILSGGLRGRELKLPEGEFTIGSNDADLSLLLDDGKQVTLLVKEDDVRIQEESVAIWYDGKPQQELSSLPTSTVIDLAGFCFLLGATDQDLSLCDVPKRKKNNRNNGKNWRTVIFLILLLTVATGVAINAWIKLNSKPIVKFDQKAWVDQQIIKPGYGKIQASWLDDGILSLNGYCKSIYTYQSFLGKLNSLGIHYVNQVVCQKDIVNNVRSILQNNGYSNISVYSESQLGTVVISGDITEDRQWQSVRERINQVKGLSSWKVKSKKEDGIGGMVEKLKRSNLLDSLSISRNGGTTTITGILSNEDEVLLNKIINKYQKNNTGIGHIIYQNIQMDRSMLSLFPSKIISFGGSKENPYLILENGMNITIGTYLPNGFKVSNLNEKGVELIKEGQLLHIPLSL